MLFDANRRPSNVSYAMKGGQLSRDYLNDASRRSSNNGALPVSAYKQEEEMMWREFNNHFKNSNRVNRELSNHHDFINWEA